jgi:zinc transport system permease protein
MNFWTALSTQTFLQNAVLAGILASIVCGITGSFVVIKRINFISGGIAHSVLGGVGLAYFLGYHPLWGAFVFAILAALIIGFVKLKTGQQEDTVISALWAIGMAIGIIFMYLTPGYSADLMTYLFGNILLVTQFELHLLIGFSLIVILLVFIFYRQFVMISFDEEYTRIRGLPVTFLYMLLLIIISITIVLLIQIVGLILVIALLTLPAAIAALFTKKVSMMILVAILLGELFTFSGLLISYEPNLPSGATIIICSGVGYLLALLIKNGITKKNNS